MADTFIETHKAKHLLSHVLVTAGARHWPNAALGESGETRTGFYADFGLEGPPTEEELGTLTDEMARLLGEVKTFRPLCLTSAEAAQMVGSHPWKRRQVEAIAEVHGKVDCFELNGFVDVCDCALKDRRELRAIHPEKFLLTGAHPIIWSHRGRDELFFRIAGELFPAPTPCDCCRP